MSADAPPIVVRDGFCLIESRGTAVAALRGVDLTVGSGERVVVHGPNGSGKTTLLRVLIGDQPLHAGEAHVAGWSVGRGDRRGLARWRARHIGWIDQHTGRTLRPELDVLDNVALQLLLTGTPRSTAREIARAALDSVGVPSLASRSIAGLSGGEAQRVAVAAALVHRPAVVLADEPAGQLDVANADDVYAVLAEAVRGTGSALVLVSHDDRAALVADRVVRIRDGRTSETWRPGAGDGDGDGAGESEGLIVDRRGWVRLPVDARRAIGDAGAVRVALGDASATLVPAHDLAEPWSHVPAADPDALFRRPGEPAAPTTTPQPVLPTAEAVSRSVQLDAVTRSFGARTVLDGFDLTVAAGEVVLVEGRSGAGKSTLLRLVAGLDDPDAGEVRLWDQPLAPLDRQARAVLRRANVGMVLQEIHLAETASLRDNLALARTVRRLAADRAGDLALLERLGVDDLADRPAASCSGGERQRAAIARAIVGGPRLVILDEPTSQLDETAAERVVGVIADLAASGAAVLVASHDHLVRTVASRVVPLEP